MISDDLKIIDGADAGSWIKPKLGETFGAVTLQIPTGFEAYARVFHPAYDPDGNPVRWAEVAKVCGTTPHQEMQWHSILGLQSADELHGSYRPGEGTAVLWSGSDPSVGSLDIESLDALCAVLIAHTADVSRCFFGLCTISGWLSSLSRADLCPLLELPYDRNHVVLAGPLSAVHGLTRDWSSSGSFEVALPAEEGDDLGAKGDPSQFSSREAPNLIWPADHQWFVASEVDFDSTLVGGSAKLIDAIIASAKLEAWQVGPADSLADDADQVNPRWMEGADPKRTTGRTRDCTLLSHLKDLLVRTGQGYRGIRRQRAAMELLIA